MVSESSKRTIERATRQAMARVKMSDIKRAMARGQEAGKAGMSMPSLSPFGTGLMTTKEGIKTEEEIYSRSKITTPIAPSPFTYKQLIKTGKEVEAEKTVWQKTRGWTKDIFSGIFGGAVITSVPIGVGAPETPASITVSSLLSTAIAFKTKEPSAIKESYFHPFKTVRERRLSIQGLGELQKEQKGKLKKAELGLGVSEVFYKKSTETLEKKESEFKDWLAPYKEKGLVTEKSIKTISPDFFTGGKFKVIETKQLIISPEHPEIYSQIISKQKEFGESAFVASSFGKRYEKQYGQYAKQYGVTKGIYETKTLTPFKVSYKSGDISGMFYAGSTIATTAAAKGALLQAGGGPILRVVGKGITSIPKVGKAFTSVSPKIWKISMGGLIAGETGYGSFKSYKEGGKAGLIEFGIGRAGFYAGLFAAPAMGKAEAYLSKKYPTTTRLKPGSIKTMGITPKKYSVGESGTIMRTHFKTQFQLKTIQQRPKFMFWGKGKPISTIRTFEVIGKYPDIYGARPAAVITRLEYFSIPKTKGQIGYFGGAIGKGRVYEILPTGKQYMGLTRSQFFMGGKAGRISLTLKDAGIKGFDIAKENLMSFRGKAVGGSIFKTRTGKEMTFYLQPEIKSTMVGWKSKFSKLPKDFSAYTTRQKIEFPKEWSVGPRGHRETKIISDIINLRSKTIIGPPKPGFDLKFVKTTSMDKALTDLSKSGFRWDLYKSMQGGFKIAPAPALGKGVGSIRATFKPTILAPKEAYEYSRVISKQAAELSGAGFGKAFGKAAEKLSFTSLIQPIKPRYELGLLGAKGLGIMNIEKLGPMIKEKTFPMISEHYFAKMGVAEIPAMSSKQSFPLRASSITPHITPEPIIPIIPIIPTPTITTPPFTPFIPIFPSSPLPPPTISKGWPKPFRPARMSFKYRPSLGGVLFARFSMKIPKGISMGLMPVRHMIGRPRRRRISIRPTRRISRRKMLVTLPSLKIRLRKKKKLMARTAWRF